MRKLQSPQLLGDVALDQSVDFPIRRRPETTASDDVCFRQSAISSSRSFSLPTNISTSF